MSEIQFSFVRAAKSNPSAVRKWLLLPWLGVFVSCWVQCSSFAQPAKVTFDTNGNFLVNGKAFFPLAIWTYDLSPQVMADIKSKGFNTVVGNGFNPDQLDFIQQNNFMALPFATEAWQKAGTNHPATLAWYITDEPEGHGLTPEDVKKSYSALKTKDPNHPAGLCHFLFEAFGKYKDTGDFTLSDVYPITSNRDVSLHNIGIHMDQARKVRLNPNHPVIPFIQDFGGPDTDGGKWAQPTPEEVRAMAFIGLVHRASGMFIFSYWAKYPKTWNSLAGLNADLAALVPWLVAEGEEINAKADKPAIELRAKKAKAGWLIIAVNSERTACDATLAIDQLADKPLVGAFDKHPLKPTGGRIVAHFAPLEVKVFLSDTGPE